MLEDEGFGSRVIEEIGYYIYALIDPRNDEPFYIGKGQGPRVFAHEFDAEITNISSEKLNRIRSIKSAGYEVKKSYFVMA